MKSIFCLLIAFMSMPAFGQTDVERLVARMLSETPLEEDLRELCDDIGGRITGSDANREAVDWAYNKLAAEGISVKKEAFEMPAKYLPGETRITVTGARTTFQPKAVSKYMSPTGRTSGELIYIADVDKADASADHSGHFLLFPSDLCLDINGLFAEYASAKKAEDLAEATGAKGIVFTSSRPQKLLYTFISSKAMANDMVQVILAREDAQRCVRLLEEGQSLSIDIDLTAEQGGRYTSHNVIAEFTGSEKPDEIIVIGAHIDSWALGTGANDNGCNVSLMMDIARQMKQLGIRPKRTIRIALWNGEEQGYFGSHAYTLQHAEELDKHKMALSVDIGSGAVTGFFTNGRASIIEDVDRVLEAVAGLGEYTQLNIPIVGTDNFDFMLQGVPNLVANHLPASYGLNYHAQSDTYDKVDLGALKRNSAIVAALTLGLANADLKDEDWRRQSRKEIEEMFEAHQLEFTMRMFNVYDVWAEGKRGRSK